MTGIDISEQGINQLREKFPAHSDKFHVTTVDKMPTAAWPLVVGIQVFQHGTREQAYEHIRQAQLRVQPGGLFAIRVNSAYTDIWPNYEIVGVNTGSGLTIRYLEGSKSGQCIHFFDNDELEELFTGWTPVLPLQLHSTRRLEPQPGQWSQWEGIWQAPV